MLPSPSYATESEFVFPEYHIHVDQQYLDALDANPLADTCYPATLYYHGIALDCEVRYRGASSRTLPKKSWKIRFPDSNNMFGKDILNFNAQYRDTTCLRDFLANRLFQFMGYPAPDVSIVNLFVNDDHAGVYLLTEQIDEYFLEKRGRAANDLYKSLNHSANMAPLAHDYDYPLVYEKKLGNEEDYRGLRLFLSKARYWTDEDFIAHIGEEVDVAGFLDFYAFLFAITSADNFCKNYYLYVNPDTDRFELFPWDNDATFGNDWKGVYNELLETMNAGSYLENQTIFQRLMRSAMWHDYYWSKVRSIATTGFPHIVTLIDQYAADVKHDMHLTSETAEEQFDTAILDLRRFITKRREYITCTELAYPPGIKETYTSNPMPDRNKTDVTLTVQADGLQAVSAVYTTDLDLSTYGDSYTKTFLPLYDDGMHNDGDSGDSVFGNTFSLPEDYKGMVPYMFISGSYNFPANGFLSINSYRTHTHMLNAENEDTSQLDMLSIGKVYFSEGDYFVEIRNEGAIPVDISYCYIQSDAYYEMTLIPENTVLASGEIIIAATDTSKAHAFFGGTTILENAIFTPKFGGTMALTKPDFSVITEKTCSEAEPLEHEKCDVVINEINYNSADDFVSGDWIELYNAEDRDIDLTGFTLSDSNDNHQFVFTIGAMIEAGGYLVIPADRQAFSACFPGVETVDDDLGFGLNGAGEMVRLYDACRVLIDSLVYDDDEPWPEEPDGQGATLSLLNPRLDNALPESWGASKNHGTPGQINDIYTSGINDNLSIGNNYPNPFHSTTTIPVSLSVSKRVQIEIFNIAGQKVAVLLDRILQEGTHNVLFDGSDYPCGLYLYRVTTNTSTRNGKMILVR